MGDSSRKPLWRETSSRWEGQFPDYGHLSPSGKLHYVRSPEPLSGSLSGRRLSRSSSSSGCPVLSPAYSRWYLYLHLCFTPLTHTIRVKQDPGGLYSKAVSYTLYRVDLSDAVCLLHFNGSRFQRYLILSRRLVYTGSISSFSLAQK